MPDDLSKGWVLPEDDGGLLERNMLIVGDDQPLPVNTSAARMDSPSRKVDPVLDSGRESSISAHPPPKNPAETSSRKGMTDFVMVGDDDLAVNFDYGVVLVDEVDSGYEMGFDDEEEKGSPIAHGNKSLEDDKTHLTAENHPDSGKKAISKEPWVGEKESMIVRITRYETSQFHIPPGLQRLGNQYSFYRRLLEDGSTFYRAFMHAYLEHILESRDVAEVARIKDCVKQCKLAIGDLGYEVKYDVIDKILEDLNKVIRNAGGSVSPVYLLLKAKAPNVSDYLVEFFRYATFAEIRKHYKHFKRLNVDPKSVLPMGSEADDHHVKAFCNALGVTIRIIYLDRPKPRNTCTSKVYGGNLHSRKSGLQSISEGTTEAGDIQALVTLAFSGKKYDILYPKKARLNAENHAGLSKEFISRAPMQHELSLRARADGAGNNDQIYGKYLFCCNPELSMDVEVNGSDVKVLCSATTVPNPYEKSFDEEDILEQLDRVIGCIDKSISLEKRSDFSVLPVGNSEEEDAKVIGKLVINKEKKAHEINKNLVGDKKSLKDLASAYPNDHAYPEILRNNFSYRRTIMGDGSCFYRSFIFGYMENLWLSKDVGEISRVVSRAQTCFNFLTNSRHFDEHLGGIESNFKAFFDFMELLLGISSEEELLFTLHNQKLSDNLVACVRWATAYDILDRRDIHRPFMDQIITGEIEEFVEFCESKVIKMEEYANHIQGVALSNALGVSFGVLQIVCDIDGFVLYSSYNAITPEGTEHADIRFTLVLSKEHYDIVSHA